MLQSPQAGRALGPERFDESCFDDGAVGVYVHLPFCERICPYCDFAVVAASTLDPALEARVVAALCAELEARREDFEGRALASLYFGGGTPSLFREESIVALVDAVRRAFPVVSDAVETTLELNPSSVLLPRLSGFRAAGVDRLSIGVQSFDDLRLKRLGRGHRAPVARRTLEAARAAGFDNLSLDLIFAGPGQTLDDLDRDLDELLEWRPEHVSPYELTFEPETPFGRALASGRLKACDEELVIDMIGRIESRLEAAGFERYEISNYARPGRRARHNARYWQRQAVLGLGMGAHSMEVRRPGRPHGARRANPRTLSDWLARVDVCPAEVGEEEILSAETARGEAVFLALRRREGLSARTFEAEFGDPPRRFFAAAIARARSLGWLCEDSPGPGDFALTPAGRLVADSVAAEFVADPEAGG
ncbi:MAG: coproporphyrinogen III oxidase [Deltaproteobacteria bacterium]|jgi:oxygen-independent coproporphyrinogen-3 oxidase|nr:coproporphyrinogen III oxidase [Deltaproteobacteria bacterium]